MTIKRCATLTLGLGLGAAFSVPTLAATFRPYDLRGQLSASELVFEGRVESVYACPDAGSGFPRTCGRVAVDRFYKGRASSGKVVIIVPGGTRPDGSSLQLVGAPTLTAGDVVIASTTVKPNSQDTVALNNFDTALLKRTPTSEGNALASNARGRQLATLPLDGRPAFAPKPYGAGPAAPSEADDDGGSDAPAAPTTATLTWVQAQAAITTGLTTIAATQSPSKPAATIAGAR